VQAGLLQRQLIVSIAAFPPDAAPARKLRAVQQVPVVVEGVETPEHLDWARQACCAAAQGYHFSRPLPAADVPRFLRGSGGHVGQCGVEDGQPAVDLGVGGGQRWGDAEGPAHPR
jgi:EAL domain